MPRGSHLRVLLSILLIVAVPWAQCQQNGTPRLSRHAQKIKSKILATQIGSPLTVVMRDGSIYLGTLKAVEDASFAVDERNVAQTVKVGYDDVDKLKSGYPDHPSQVAKSPSHRLLVSVIVVAGLLILVFALLASDKS
jgi:small nuclear ribonucleoprotein (snRNP)-like protein